MIIEWASLVCLALGGLLSMAGGLGLHRFPDFYSRLHAAGLSDTLCVALIMLGLAFQAGLTLVSVKLFLIFAFLYFTNPTASYCLGHAAWRSGLKPYRRGQES
ncbi:monovalent cation/H(+) antiporter subunit G [Bowmanella dokdonensis]|uniref:Monovalent cation/H(+) antiporter subunit G n=1 Tax=Bowmanella dokdonensis TaxID=751969 RepID=A0A939IQG7_9ALTE|nr:monovalent cation/H(+) antiporter subunit G [Bowmanella dokdonensis]MBN7825014.1 monovalent cation/H(+) antiporter subunit G [Bowmanella dokdonensis]